MGRLFDGNTSNYLSRAAVVLGLDGLTECSYGFWIKMPTSHATLLPYIVAKHGGGASLTLNCLVKANSRKIGFSIERVTPNENPEWTLSTDIGDNVWTRMVFTFKRNLITSADGLVYQNGTSVSTTYAANGYASDFTLSDPSETYYLGIRGDGEAWATALTGSLAWVNVWNRQLTAAEVVNDYNDPRAVTSGLVSSVRLCPDTDTVLGGSMTVNGTLHCMTDPFRMRVVPVTRPRSFAPCLAR